MKNAWPWLLLGLLMPIGAFLLLAWMNKDLVGVMPR